MYLNRAFKYAEFLFSDTFRSARTPDSPLSLYEGWSGIFDHILHHDDQSRHEDGHIALPEVDNQEDPTRAAVGEDDTEEKDEEAPADVADVAAGET